MSYWRSSHDNNHFKAISSEVASLIKEAKYGGTRH
nr:MAG TPA: hypothetical protein [Caudoviricetes sp.]